MKVGEGPERVKLLFQRFFRVLEKLKKSLGKSFKV